MNDGQLKDATARLRKIEDGLKELATKQRATETRLKIEREMASKLTEQRDGLVAELATANEEQAKAIHKKLDSIDPTITKTTRLAESFERSLKEIASQTATLTKDRDKLNEAVAAENNARAFQAWTASIEQGIEHAHAKLADARLALGALSMNCARGIERFGPAAAVLGEQIDKFIHKQSNPESLLNFKMAIPFYRSDLRVVVSPMVVKG